MRRLPPGLDSQDFSLGELGALRQTGAESFPGPLYQGLEIESGPEQARVFEKGHGVQHRRSAGARSMLRSRSVDFNFNSSSTDGSVFDYDKAVHGLREERELGEENVDMRHHTPSKKQQQRVAVDTAQQKLKYGLYPEEDRTHLMHNSPRNRLSFALPDPKDDLIHTGWRSHSNDPYLQNERDRRFTAEQSRPESSRSGETGRGPSGPSSLPFDSNNKERFIRLSLSPGKTSQTSADQFHFQGDFTRVDHAVLQGGAGQEEEESGFDTAEGDPYDSIVTRIREISSSNYTNVEKLQRVSDLISKSQKGDGRQQNIEASLLKSAKSTIDLTKSNRISTNYERDRMAGVSVSNETTHSHPRERPVDVISRMKQNIAKSMENLSVDLPSQGSNASHRYVNERYISELRLNPVFTLPRKTEVTVGKPSVSDVETSKSSPLLVSPGEVDSRTRTGSDVDEWSRVADGDCEGSTSSKDLRPSGLPIPSTRNFISPSFLRPAMSMQDISSRASLTAANLGLWQELEGDPDFGALKDIEILNALQTNPLGQLEGLHSANAGSNYNMEQPVDPSGKSKEQKNKLEEKRNQREPQASGQDIIANFVMYGQGASPSPKGSTGADHGSRYATSSSNSNTSPSWFVARGSLQQGRSFSTEEEGETSSALLFFQDKINLNRLSREAEQEYISQEDVAQSLKNTQMILENEEKRQLRMRGVRNASFEEADVEVDQGERLGQAVSASASLDNGYSSWASRLLSTLSTSSEGGGEGSGRTAETQAALSHVSDRERKTSSTSEDTYSNGSQDT
ncbi:hypothetical protein EGW08_022354 [Elysia chlorotica]|uniref:Uncharacterized protein n=1 Tax=Elysia chlorotica TaxID=188477 RepID=A0A3S0Z3E0_ELYCH|nr:hypothetical protein EGW08_022354 [Elysia chlorotica]